MKILKPFLNKLSQEKHSNLETEKHRRFYKSVSFTIEISVVRILLTGFTWLECYLYRKKHSLYVQAGKVLTL